MKNAFTMKNILRPEPEGPATIRSRSRRIKPVSCNRIAARCGLTGKSRAIEPVRGPTKGTP